MSQGDYPKEYLDKAQRYYSERRDWTYVENKLADQGIDEKIIPQIINDLKKNLGSDNTGSGGRTFLIGLAIVVASGFLVSAASGWLFQNQFIGIIGIIAMVIGFVRMSNGLKVLLGMEESAFFRQFQWFKLNGTFDPRKKKKPKNNEE